MNGVAEVGTLFLGNSLTTLVLSRDCGHFAVVDTWEGGSLLYGLDVLGGCVDKVPLFSESGVIEPEREYCLDFTSEYLGSESNYSSKLEVGGVSPQRNWLVEISGSKCLPKEGWCSYFRELGTKIRVNLHVGNIEYVDLGNKAVKVGGIVLKYEELVNTMPLPYFLGKLRGVDREIYELADELRYLPMLFYVVVINEVMKPSVVHVGRRALRISDVVVVPLEELGVTLIYASLPLRGREVMAGLQERIKRELFRLTSIKESSVLVERYHYERYSYLGESKAVRELTRVLSRHGIRLEGRYGAWEEKAISEILRL